MIDILIDVMSALQMKLINFVWLGPMALQPVFFFSPSSFFQALTSHPVNIVDPEQTESRILSQLLKERY